VTVAIIGLIAAVYEFVAVRSERLPTITDLVKSLPLVARVAVIAVVVLALVDHFGPGSCSDPADPILLTRGSIRSPRYGTCQCGSDGPSAG
jgi:hypothetical protein